MLHQQGRKRELVGVKEAGQGVIGSEVKIEVEKTQKSGVTILTKIMLSEFHVLLKRLLIIKCFGARGAEDRMQRLVMPHVGIRIKEELLTMTAAIDVRCSTMPRCSYMLLQGALSREVLTALFALERVSIITVLLKSTHLHKETFTLPTKTMSCRSLMLLQGALGRKSPTTLFTFERVSILTVLLKNKHVHKKTITLTTKTMSCGSLMPLQGALSRKTLTALFTFERVNILMMLLKSTHVDKKTVTVMTKAMSC